ncbi:MAG: hypothetical protein HQ541_09885 [Mariniphaga sp.]|nr:hypothetical protein [Mariniphaga sp.]
MNDFIKGSYGYDLQFLQKYIEPIELVNGNGRVLISGEYQGRVMTTSSNGNIGASYGWINHGLFDSGEFNEQFNPIGGEERLWLGPEGGQFSVYFKKGDEQIFANWVVPKEIDTVPFDLVEKTDEYAKFEKEFLLVNASGINLNIGINRNVKILSQIEIENEFHMNIDPSLEFVAYQSENILKNTGLIDWNEKDGLLSIWMLCMFNPSEDGIVFIPFKKGEEKELGKIVTDDYFGKVPSDRLIAKDGIVFFKTDGKLRSKIGIPPQRALPYCGSYDAKGQVLTILWYSQPDELSKYVNSVWGNQDDPLSGDVVNSYNDGPGDDGTVLGPFYEIESSSPAAMLKAGQEIKHTQRIFHISGDENQLNIITEKLFNLSVNEIKNIF